MRFTEKVILSAGDMSLASVNSIGIQKQQGEDFTIQAYWTGAPVGNFKLQISCDNVIPGTGADPAANVINWTDYTGSTQAAGGAAGNFAWIVSSGAYQWIRLFYTKTSGTGSVTAMYNGMGV